MEHDMFGEHAEVAVAPAGKQKAPHQIRYEDRGTYLYVFISGEKDTVELARACLAEVVAKCQSKPWTKVLVEEELGAQLTGIGMYTIAAEIAALARGLKIAYVDRHKSHAVENYFGETVAINRGAWLQVFDNVPQAEAWLLAQ